MVVLWGAELGWRGQREGRRQFKRLQYQALRKYTGAILVTNEEKLNVSAGVEDVDTILDAGQHRYMSSYSADPSTTKEVPLLP